MSQQLILITGLSGAGKSTASKALEDVGFYCIDNLPVYLLPTLLKESERQQDHKHLALVMDTRDHDFLTGYKSILTELEASQFLVKIIFLDADDKTLLRRYSEMRRRHPFDDNSVRAGISLEREKLAGIKARADQVIDTSTISPHDLRREVVTCTKSPKSLTLKVGLVSFGFKHGPPAEADIILDVRFLPNPYFVPELKSHSGLEEAVSTYVLESNQTREFLDKLTPLLTFLVPQYRREGKLYLTIGIGCTGGRHRSVAVAERLGVIMRESGEGVMVSHRDLRA